MNDTLYRLLDHDAGELPQAAPLNETEVTEIMKRFKEDNKTNSAKRRRISVRRKLIVSAAAAVIAAASLPAMTAFGSGTAYYLLYNIAPSVAQTFKPVQQTCEDNGFEMTVISAERKGSEASVYLAMHDTTGSSPDGEYDLYDSYRINVPKDMTGHCSFSDYDADTHTAYFVVHLETMDGSEMPEDKVTFFVTEMLMGKKNYNEELDGIDLGSIPRDADTVSIDEIDGFEAYQDISEVQGLGFLPDSDTPISTPAEGVSVRNIGYADGALHILTKYDNTRETDNHGFISLVDKNGKEIYGDVCSYYKGDHKDCYVEQIIPVEYERLAEYTLHGDFTTCQAHITGDWQVTFPLE